MAHRPKVENLSDKHWKALELIDAGETNMSNVARHINMEPTDFLRLVHGNVQKMGNIASVFNLEYSKIIHKKINESEKNITRLLNECQEVSLAVLTREIKVYEDKKKLTEDNQKMLTYLVKAMATLKPSAPKSLNVSQTWNYTKGLSPQELEHEFSRLSGLSEGPSNAGAVQDSKQG